jgi:chemotaxis protein MotB
MIKSFHQLLVMALSTSCVSKKIYNDLESKYTDLKKENRSLADDNSALVKLKPIRIRSRWFKNGCKQCYSSISKSKAGMQQLRLN